MTEIHRESVLGLDNIRLDLPVAGLGSRSLAVFLDYIGLAIVAMAWIFGSILLAAAVAPDWTPVFVVAGIFLLDWGYFAAQEILGGGRTLGKRLLKLRVVTAEGGTPGAGALLIRNLVRSLDFLCGVPLMAFDPLSRRLGDRLAGTLVVHDRGREAAPMLGRVPAGWGARELAVVESFLSRASTLHDRALSYEMADRILERIRRDAPDLLAGVDTRTDPVAAIRQALQVEEG
ncbi:MAG TPA: RDD family protein [Thermoanaerobaculia bacterium]|nr:RDD family protein [Thermoanaerobaculia bacterium]